jgi:hypothetical protein
LKQIVNSSKLIWIDTALRVELFGQMLALLIDNTQGMGMNDENETKGPCTNQIQSGLHVTDMCAPKAHRQPGIQLEHITRSLMLLIRHTLTDMAC